MGIVEAKWTVFSTKLQDLRKSPDNDLTPKGIQPEADSFTQANPAGADVKSALAGVVKSMEKDEVDLRAAR